MKQPKKLSLAQKKLISRCGLNPKEWMCKSDSKEYLCVVSASMEEKIINKNTLEVTEGKKALISLATDRTFKQKR